MAISGDTDAVVREIEEFVDGLRSTPSEQEFDRVLSTLLFTDIVGSTATAMRLGDRAWSELLERHVERATQLVQSFHGRVVDTAGDGILASFDGTGRAIRCARAVVDDAHEGRLEYGDYLTARRIVPVGALLPLYSAVEGR